MSDNEAVPDEVWEQAVSTGGEVGGELPTTAAAVIVQGVTHVREVPTLRHNSGAVTLAAGSTFSLGREPHRRRLVVSPQMLDPADADDQVTVQIPNPAAGVSVVNVNVPDGEVWDVLAVRYTVTASAAVGNRIPELQYLSPAGLPYFTVSHVSTLSPSNAQTFSFWQGGSGVGGAGNKGTGLPLGLVLTGNSQIRVSVFGLDAADTITNIYVTYRRRVPPAYLVACDNPQQAAGGYGLIIPTGEVTELRTADRLYFAAVGGAVRLSWLSELDQG